MTRNEWEIDAAPVPLDHDDWADASTLEVREIAALMGGVHPRNLKNATQQDDNHRGGRALDLSHEDRAVRTAVRAGELLCAPDATGQGQDLAHILVRSLIPWLRLRGKDWLADRLDAKRRAGAVDHRPMLEDESVDPHDVSPAAAISRPSDPAPLSSRSIAHCFAKLHGKTEKAWMKSLGNKPKWLSGCVVIPGQRGVMETKWNPVLIGAAFVSRRTASQNEVRGRFQSQHLLKPWLEKWKDYEADNFDAD